MDSRAGNSYSGLMASMTPPHILVCSRGRGQEDAIPGAKALHPVFFRPMIHYMLDAAAAIAHRSLSLVVGRDERNSGSNAAAIRDLRFFRSGVAARTADALLARRARFVGGATS